MKTSIKLLSLLFACALTFSCGMKDDPTNALKSFFEKLDKKDIDGASKFATKDSKTTLDLMKKGIEASKGDPSSKAESARNFTYDKPTINGSTATVKVTDNKDNTSLVFTLKKEDGEWKVDFTMENLMKMGMEKMQNSKE